MTPNLFTAGAVLCCWLFFSAGCSLKYSDGKKNVESEVPEFVFANADFSRWEKNKKTLSMRARTLEQYKGGSTYADSVSFTAYADDGSAETEGSCGLVAFDSKQKIYSLYDGIELTNEPRDVRISADELRWDGNTEQLTSRRTDTITMKKNGTVVRGSGFSASGVSNRFVFTGAVSGTVETDEDAEEGGDAQSRQ
ncbi:LPS export ABC transporter periplasmic protein LptC [Treponema socranskii]|uniref:LPS export ABC transporter periplasmic protein LptC n=1 Tax=Treponema socranskii TaxID=53419 RepID=UPI003D8EC1AE